MSYEKNKERILKVLSLEIAIVFDLYLDGVKSQEFRGVETCVKDIYCTLRLEQMYLRNDKLHLLPGHYRSRL
jgi:hypothetical protein